MGQSTLEADLALLTGHFQVFEEEEKNDFEEVMADIGEFDHVMIPMININKNEESKIDDEEGRKSELKWLCAMIESLPPNCISHLVSLRGFHNYQQRYIFQSLFLFFSSHNSSHQFRVSLFHRTQHPIVAPSISQRFFSLPIAKIVAPSVASLIISLPIAEIVSPSITTPIPSLIATPIPSPIVLSSREARSDTVTFLTPTAGTEDEDIKEVDVFGWKVTKRERSTLTPVAAVHETEWCKDEEAIKLPVGGNVAFRDW
eukprot:CAMPEP_0171296540 /NCGR_PEP_ID=MMETSP0816-20121228/5218_1 /TAXON_ID=420281 /ORGANISM="Proboscia inermis, Strain CCAP1064/1" /LENGTH=257 /DNA_ID=CAMNT_0011770069 /DNA_START=76 /DNA_END=846 /DNA_ORIENTATION=-